MAATRASRKPRARRLHRAAPIPSPARSSTRARRRQATPRSRLPPQYYNNAPRGGGFMAGALQTAAGVAGGVVLGNMLTNMFSHHQPEEIVNIINEPAQPADNSPVNAVEDYNQADDSQFLNQDAGLQQDNGNDYVPASSDEDWNNDFAGDDFGGDDFGGDDDNWV
ncbi:DUF2076 domain-containing protein [Cronobacter malonaticus]|uniref:DUF2076 domain-containing protein n=1 Tax=Cronobacter malonaticus TaxID=413503 RepID=UPI00387DBFB3